MLVGMQYHQRFAMTYRGPRDPASGMLVVTCIHWPSENFNILSLKAEDDGEAIQKGMEVWRNTCPRLLVQDD